MSSENDIVSQATPISAFRFAQGKGSGQRSIPSLFPTPGVWRANQISSLKMTYLIEFHAWLASCGAGEDIDGIRARAREGI